MQPYQLLFDKVLSRTDPEKAHHAAFRAIRAARPATGLRRPAGHRGRTTRVMGLDFPGLLGLAAGFDKNGVGIDALANLGFGFVEIGTVTGEPQPGNPRPRLARLTADRAVVNRMGFNNDGAEAVARRLASRRLDRTGRRAGVPLGINIGKTKVVPEEYAVRDYEKSTTLLTPYADYLVVNVSSPNTPGLRDLQAVEKLEPLLRRRPQPRRRPLRPPRPAAGQDRPRPRATTTCSPSPTSRARLGLDGIVATNTTISRDGLASTPEQVEAAGAGGLSGRPLRARATEVLRLLRDRVGPRPGARRGRRHQHARGRRRAPGGRRRPAAGLHRVRLRRTAVARPDERHARRSCERPACDTATGALMTPALRRPTAGSDGRSRAAVRRHRPARRAAGRLGADRLGQRAGEVRALGHRGAGAPGRRGQAAVGVLRAVRLARHRRARAGHRDRAARPVPSSCWT